MKTVNSISTKAKEYKTHEQTLIQVMDFTINKNAATTLLINFSKQSTPTQNIYNKESMLEEMEMIHGNSITSISFCYESN